MKTFRFVWAICVCVYAAHLHSFLSISLKCTNGKSNRNWLVLMKTYPKINYWFDSELQHFVIKYLKIRKEMQNLPHRIARHIYSFSSFTNFLQFIWNIWKTHWKSIPFWVSFPVFFFFFGFFFFSRIENGFQFQKEWLEWPIDDIFRKPANKKTSNLLQAVKAFCISLHQKLAIIAIYPRPELILSFWNWKVYVLDCLNYFG